MAKRGHTASAPPRAGLGDVEFLEWRNRRFLVCCAAILEHLCCVVGGGLPRVAQNECQWQGEVRSQRAATVHPLPCE